MVDNFKSRFVEVFQILYQRLLLGEKLSAQLTDVGIHGVFAPHPSKIRDFCHLLPREKALDCISFQQLGEVGFILLKAKRNDPISIAFFTALDIGSFLFTLSI